LYLDEPAHGWLVEGVEEMVMGWFAVKFRLIFMIMKLIIN